MQRIAFSLLALLMATMSWAVPAKRATRLITQADGTTEEVTLMGDEYSHYWQTADGRLYSLNEDGTFSRMFTKPSRKTERRIQSNERRAQRATARRNVGTSSASTGNKKGIIILVNYKDKKMVHTNDEFKAQMNEHNYSQNGHIGSLSDYFYDQSYGQLSIEFDVVGPYDVSQNLSYYGQNVGGSEGEDRYPGALITEAVNLADADGVDFSQYDWDGDKEVDQIFVIYAGYGEASGAAANTIWPHEWSLSSASYFGSGGNGPIQKDGVKIDTYACSSELSGTYGSKMDGIGTAAHEFSHCMGLPDFYDTQGSSPGMSVWSLMDYGCYNGEGCVPSPYTSYERWYSGWLTPTELTTGCEIQNMKPITEAPEAYIIYNEANRNEYYMLENHQKTHAATEYRNWDKEAYAHGMLVLHVDYNASAWSGNTVNNTKSRQRMTIVPANNRHEYNFSASVVAGNTYPGTGKKTSLTNSTTPAATLYNANSDGKKFLNKPIENIAEKSGHISFTFNGGASIGKPVLGNEPAIIDSTGFVATWTNCEGAESYTLELTDRTPSPTALLFEENFETNEKFAVSSDQSNDISGSLNNYLTTSGWTGSKLYLAPKKMKFGSSLAPGKLTSPLCKAPSDGTVKVTLAVDKYNNDTGFMNVSIMGTDGSTKQKVAVTPNGTQNEVTFEGVNEDFRVNLETSTKRAYLRYLCVEASSETGMQKANSRTITFENILGTTYTVSDLTPGHTYVCRVKAVSSKGVSEWSNEVTLTLPRGTTAIDRLYNESINLHDSTIYNLAGQRVSKPTQGIYIVGGKKILLR